MIEQVILKTIKEPMHIPLSKRIQEHAKVLYGYRCKLTEEHTQELFDLIPETIQLLDLWWSVSFHDQSEKDKLIFIHHHPFMQYIVHLLRIRILPAQASFPQCQNVVESMMGI